MLGTPKAIGTNVTTYRIYGQSAGKPGLLPVYYYYLPSNMTYVLLRDFTLGGYLTSSFLFYVMKPAFCQKAEQPTPPGSIIAKEL
jgi:hypothetical protein